MIAGIGSSLFYQLRRIFRPNGRPSWTLSVTTGCPFTKTYFKPGQRAFQFL